jgi:DNA-directed RNA polymerase specialized sigma24 family protein
VVSTDDTPSMSLRRREASTHREAFLDRLTPDERALFHVWMQQRTEDLPAEAWAHKLGMSVAEFNNAKKRLRRRCATVLEALNLSPADLFDPQRPADAPDRRHS